MKLNDTQILAAITHQERPVRDAALFYFAGAPTPNAAVMPQVRKAIETHGVETAFSIYPYLETLALNDRSLPWVLTEIARTDRPNTDAVRDFLDWLWEVVAEADPDLVAKHERQIVDNPNIDVDILHSVKERLRLRGLSSAELWNELEAACDKADKFSADESVSEADVDETIDEIYRLTEAVARCDQPDADRVMLMLMTPRKSASDFSWKEVAAIRIVGELRLSAATAALVAKLRGDGEADDSHVMAEDCVRALLRIGGDDVLHALQADFAKGSPDFRMFAAVVMEGLRTENVLGVLKELLAAEDDPHIRVYLAQATLGQFDSSVVDTVREVVLASPPGREVAELRQGLVVLCKLTGESFPELAQWSGELDQDESLRQQYREPGFPVEDSIGQVVKASRAAQATRRSALPDAWFRTQRVGRNELCPCGSGKKFKKCCMTQ